jgi:hypothetical protein
MSTAATSHTNPAPRSLTREERAARNGRGIAFAGLGFGIYLLLIALVMLYPDPGANVLGFLFIALAGAFFTVIGAVGVARSAKRIREFDATRGGRAAGV